MNSVGRQLENLKTEITNELPRDTSASDVKYEGPELVVYTRGPKKLVQNSDLARRLAGKLRKRITVRPDPDVLSDPRETEPKTLSVILEETGVTSLDFHTGTDEVVIKAEKPGMVIGRHGSTLREIAQKVGWTSEAVRTPPTKFSTVSNTRNFLEQEREGRRHILECTDRQIHREQFSDDEQVRITALGYCREVSRASFTISTPETRILIDCGDKPGPDDVPYLQVLEALGSDVNSLDTAVFIHAHLDHSALVPLPFKYGYDGPACTTEPTRDLVGPPTLDYFNVAPREGCTSPHESKMVREAIKHITPLEYGDTIGIVPDVKLTFHNADHILGSAVSYFHIGDGLYNVAFSNDIHYEDTRLLNGAVNDSPCVETFVFKSTYGGRDDYQTDQQGSKEHPIEVANETYDHDNKVVVPAFTADRSQEIMLVLEETTRSGKTPEMPVRLDEMIWGAMAIHTTYPGHFRDDLCDRISHKDGNPFLAEEFNHIDDDEEERQGAVDDDQTIIPSISGVATGGPITPWLCHIGLGPESWLAFAGYQAQGTLGRRIQNGWDEIPVNGRDSMGRSDTLKLRMDMETVDGLPGHVDRQGPENFVKAMDSCPEKVLCARGDERSAQDPSSALYHDYNMWTSMPKNLETPRFK